MRALIFPHRTRIIGCFAASMTRSGVTPLILRASNTTTRFSSRSSNFCNFTPRTHQKRSQVRNPKVRNVLRRSEIKNFPGGACPQAPPSRRPTHTLIAYWNPPFQNSRSATACDLNVVCMWPTCYLNVVCMWPACDLNVVPNHGLHVNNLQRHVSLTFQMLRNIDKTT